MAIEQNEQAAQPVASTQPQQPMSIEDRIGRSIGWPEPVPDAPRDNSGRFQAKEQPPAQDVQPQDEQEDVPQEQQDSEPTGEPEADGGTESPPTIEIDPDEQFIDVEERLPGGEKSVKKYSLNELKAQRMMQADYQRKTQEIAAERRNFQTQVSQAVQKERTEYLQTLQTLQQAVIASAAPELQNVNWNQLAAENPGEYVRLSNRAREVQASVERLQQEQQNVQHKQNTERQASIAQAISESREKIKAAIPDWSDATYQKVMKRAVETYGFTQQEISAVYDHRLIQMLHDADQFRAMQAQRPITEKKLVAVPKVIRPGTQQRSQNNGQQQMSRSRERLKQSGSIDDLADVVGRIIKRN